MASTSLPPSASFRVDRSDSTALFWAPSNDEAWSFSIFSVW